jgi:DNA-binding SARP family transcriptional activator
VLPELQRLIIEQPLRERLQALAMLALYRCGRQTEALDLYGEFRSRLRQQLGLEPARELRELQGRILQHDHTLTASATKEPARVGVARAAQPAARPRAGGRGAALTAPAGGCPAC